MNNLYDNKQDEIFYQSAALKTIDSKIIIKNINKITGDQNQIDRICQSLLSQLEAKILAWFDKWKLSFKELRIIISADGKSYQIQCNPHSYYYQNDLCFQNQIDYKNEHQQLPAFTFETNLDQLMANLNQDDIKISFKTNQKKTTFQFQIDGKIIDHYENIFDYNYKYWDYYQIDFSSLNDPLMFKRSYFASNVQAISDYLPFWKTNIEDHLRLQSNKDEQFKKQLLALDPDFNPEKIFYVKEGINELYQPESFNCFYPLTLEHSKMQINCLIANTHTEEIDYNQWKYKIEFNQLDHAIQIINDLKKWDQNGQLDHLKQTNNGQNQHFLIFGPIDDDHHLNLILNDCYQYRNDGFSLYVKNRYRSNDLWKWIQQQSKKLKTITLKGVLKIF